MAAGIHNDSSATRRAGAWSEDAIARAVAQFVVEQMSHSHVLYQVWAKGRRWLPSMATIRRTHTWDAAREAAMRLLYEDDHWAERYAEAIRVEVDRRVIEFLVEGAAPPKRPEDTPARRLIVGESVPMGTSSERAKDRDDDGAGKRRSPAAAMESKPGHWWRWAWCAAWCLASPSCGGGPALPCPRACS
ncbi:hypothetical protein GCM10025876_18000 [Demequina litorisediminis]|uniref:Uncharacterized protein n=1 Tax=Demequina litorisediminis TaxID=1849022 RepID=A0ABQ6IEJ0_9MICO|nr:hypothetical protein GCM10025876_18000 [Demequina litorisediminis]